MRIYGCQLDIAWENKAENYRRTRFLLSKPRIKPGSLIILPELFATGFSMNAEGMAESDNGPTMKFMRQLAKDKNAFVLGGLALRRSSGQVCNEAVCVAPSGGRIARYAKIHLFTPGGETEHYNAGSEPAVFNLQGMKAALSVCYDLRFPELYRVAAQYGAEVMIVIANWPDKRHAHWGALLRSRAIENQAYVVGVNRCGKDPKLDYAGGSMVVGPRGDVIAEAGNSEVIISAELDEAETRQWRGEFSALKDMRTEFRIRPRGKGRGAKC